MGNSIRIFLMVIAVFITEDTFAENLKITFIIPDAKGPVFWQMVTENSQAAAKSLGVDLEVIYSANNRFKHKAQIEKIVRRKDKPDYIIIRPFQGTVEHTFNLLEHHEIPFVTLERAFINADSKSLGAPKQKYKHWIGQITYDNVAGGKLLIDALIREHLTKNTNETIRITGIGGNHDTLSLDRQLALEHLMIADESQPIVVNQIFPMSWSPNLVTQRFPQIMKRYPKTNTFWCAGDAMALAIFKQLQQNGIDNMVIGGFDWLPEVLQQIQAGNITASVGGHFLMAASAVVKIVDYHQGVDRFVLPPFMNDYELITQDNVGEYLHFMNNKDWNTVDFSVFLHANKTPNSETKSPELNLKNMIKQLAF